MGAKAFGYRQGNFNLWVAWKKEISGILTEEKTADFSRECLYRSKEKGVAMQALDYFGIETGKGRYHEEAFYGIAAVFNMLEKSITGYLKHYGLSPAKFNSLMVIRHESNSKGISQVEIGNRLIVTASNMTRLLDRLQKDGLIDRYPQEGDRRVNLIKISRKGVELLDKVWPGYCKRIDELASRLGKRDRKTISGLLIKWFRELKDEV